MRRIIASALALGCSDYSVGDKADAADLPAPTTPEPVPAPQPDTIGVRDSATAPATCADVDLTGWAWIASAPFATEPDLLDAAGVPFHDPGFDAAGWTAVTLPDRNTPIGFDRAFRAQFELPVLPPGATLDLQSDDGLWIWLNGASVGHWGGAFQQEGCVNENAECIVTTTVPAVDVTALLVVGTNTIAGRVSNPVQNSWFEVTATCVE